MSSLRQLKYKNGRKSMLVKKEQTIIFRRCDSYLQSETINHWPSLCTSACKPKLEKPIFFLASHPLAQAIAVILNQWYFCLYYNKWCKQLWGTKKASSSILTYEDFRKNKKLGATWSILSWKRLKLIINSYIVNALDWKGKAWHRIEWDRRQAQK